MYAYGYGYPMGSQSNPAYIPPSIPNLGLWLKADAGVTLVGGAVDAWADQSGNGRNFSAPVAANRPAYSGTLNGLPVLTFDGSTDYLTGNAASLTLAQNVTGITMIAVVKYLASTQQRVFGLSNGLSVNNPRALLGVSTTQWQVGGRRLDADGAVNISGGTSSANWVVQSGVIRYSLATAGVFINGASQSDSAFQTAGSSSDTASLISIIGGGTNLANFLQGDLAELIVYPRAITPSEQTQVENYLMQRWGI
jgi:hypothetical protein